MVKSLCSGFRNLFSFFSRNKYISVLYKSNKNPRHLHSWLLIMIFKFTSFPGHTQILMKFEYYSALVLPRSLGFNLFSSTLAPHTHTYAPQDIFFFFSPLSCSSPVRSDNRTMKKKKGLEESYQHHLSPATFKSEPHKELCLLNN